MWRLSSPMTKTKNYFLFPSFPYKKLCFVCLVPTTSYKPQRLNEEKSPNLFERWLVGFQEALTDKELHHPISRV